MKAFLWLILFLSVVGLCREPAAADRRDKKALPPVARPTSQTQAPLTAQEEARHTARIRAAKTSHPDAFPAAHELMPGLPEILAREEEERRRGLVFSKLVRGDPARREVALTFDDGPHPTFTPRLLTLLQQLKVPATFFLVGKKVDEAPYLVARMAHEGHEVANHTYHHLNLTKCPPELVEGEIRMANDAIRRASGIPPIFFRPPGGQYNDATIQAAQKLKMTTALWTDDPGDYAGPGEDVLKQRLFSHIANGAVILLHDGVPQTYDLLPELVNRLHRAGYRFVTLAELALPLEKRFLVQSKAGRSAGAPE